MLDAIANQCMRRLASSNALSTLVRSGSEWAIGLLGGGLLAAGVVCSETDRSGRVGTDSSGEQKLVLDADGGPAVLGLGQFDLVAFELGAVDGRFGGSVVGFERAIASEMSARPSRLPYVVLSGEVRQRFSALDTSAVHWLEPTATWNWGQVCHLLLDTAIYLSLAGALGFVIWNRLLQREVARRQRAEARLQSLADNTPGAIYRYVLHPDGSDALLYISSGCADIWGISSQAAQRGVAQLWEFIHPDDVPGARLCSTPRGP